MPDARSRRAEGHQQSNGRALRAKRRIQVVCRRHAVGDLVLQLRRPPGHLFGLPPAREGNGAYDRAARAARFVLRLGLWPRGAVRRRDRRPGAPKDRDSRRAPFLEPDLHGDGAVPQFPPPVPLPRGRGTGRDILLPGLDVDDQRLPRKGHALARHGPASDQRLRRERSRAASSQAPSGSITAGAGRSSSSAVWGSCSASRSTPCSSSRSAGPPISPTSARENGRISPHACRCGNS